MRIASKYTYQIMDTIFLMYFFLGSNLFFTKKFHSIMCVVHVNFVVVDINDAVLCTPSFLSIQVKNKLESAFCKITFYFNLTYTFFSMTSVAL